MAERGSRFVEVVRLIGVAVIGATVVIVLDWRNIDTARGPASLTMAGPPTARDLPVAQQLADPLRRTVVDHEDAVITGLDALARMEEEPGADSVLASIALSDPQPVVREEALLSLGDRGGAVALHTLQQALQDEHRRVRKAAIRTIAQIGGAEAEQALAAVLSVDDPALLLDAIDALGRIGGPNARSHLGHLTQHESELVREAAAQWVAELSSTPPPAGDVL